MAASQGFVGGWEGRHAGARLSALRLCNNTKKGGVIFAGRKKKKKQGELGLVVAWSWVDGGGHKPYPSPSAARAK